MELFKPFVYKLAQNVIASFRGYNLLWHVLAIVLTYLLATGGFDWFYFEHTRASILFALLIPAAFLGFIIPVFIPSALFILGLARNNKRMLNAGYALTQSVALAWIISSVYKTVTGRAHPELFTGSRVLLDVTHEFHFGFLQGGIFWGWPSSHTAVAFALATTAMILYSKTRTKIIALLFALYVGIGVSVTIHWFSDFVAGAIIGTVIGVVVGQAFKARLLSLSASRHPTGP